MSVRDDTVLRAVVRAVVVEAVRPRGKKRRRLHASTTLARIITQYPAIVVVSKETPRNAYGNWDSVVTSRDPQTELEKLAVCATLDGASYVRIGRLLHRIRKALGRKAILAAFEDETLAGVLDEMGLM